MLKVVLAIAVSWVSHAVTQWLAPSCYVDVILVQELGGPSKQKRVVEDSRQLMLFTPPTKERELVDEGDHIAWGPKLASKAEAPYANYSISKRL
jgi:hypothetical protein